MGKYDQGRDRAARGDAAQIGRMGAGSARHTARAGAGGAQVRAGAEEKRAAMDAKVGRLNAREKQVLHLRYGREMSWTAVARRCYISVSAARWCERGAVDRLIWMDEQ